MDKYRSIMVIAKRGICNLLCIACAPGFSAAVALGAGGSHTLSVKGVVFMDANGNGQQDLGESGVQGALVSDGESFVETSRNGQYSIKVEVPEEVNGLTFVGRSSHIFLVNPPGTFFVTPNALSLPPAGERFRADFGLRDASKTEDGNFTFIHIADPQFGSEGEAARFTKALKEMERFESSPAFILNCGDSVGDAGDAELELFARSVRDAGLGIPFFTAFGGHSGNLGPEYKGKPTLLFERSIGPMYYSFNYGGCHFIAYTVEQEFLSKKHIEAQERWVAADLARTPRNRPVVWAQHRAYSSIPALLKGRQVPALLHGHFHLNARYTAGGVPALVTSQPVMGGFSGEPSGFRVLTFREKKLVGWEYRFFGINRKMTLVAPAQGAIVDSQESRITVSAYDSSKRPRTVAYFLDDSPRGIPLESRGDFTWISPTLRLAEGTHSLRVRVTDSAGEVWPEVKREFSVETVARPKPSAAWPAFGGGPAQTHQSGTDVAPPLRLAWCAPTGGTIGLSSPVVADGRVHIAAQDFGQRSERCAVFAFDAKTGMQIWRFPTEWSVKHTVCVGDGKVFAYSTSATLYAIDAATGKEMWRKSLGSPGHWNVSWPPSYADGRVFVCDKGAKAMAFDASTGRKIWEVQTKPPRIIWWMAFSAPVAEGRIYFRDGAYDTKTGRKLFEYNNTWTSSSAVMKGTYIGFVDHKLNGLDAATGEVLWKCDLGGHAKVGLICSVAASTDGDVYVGQFGELVAYNPAKKRERWRFSSKTVISDLRTPRVFRSSMVVSTPAVSDKWVYFGANDGNFYIVNRRTGEKAWSYEIGSPVGSSPAVTGNAVFVGAMDGCVYAFTTEKAP